MEFTINDTGISLRDWFAGMALQAQLPLSEGRESTTELAETCYFIADKMLEARQEA